MWLQDVTKALYYLNASGKSYSIVIEAIENGYVWFSNGERLQVKYLADMYDQYIKCGVYTDVI